MANYSGDPKFMDELNDLPGEVWDRDYSEFELEDETIDDNDDTGAWDTGEWDNDYNPYGG